MNADLQTFCGQRRHGRVLSLGFLVSDVFAKFTAGAHVGSAGRMSILVQQSSGCRLDRFLVYSCRSITARPA